MKASNFDGKLTYMDSKSDCDLSGTIEVKKGGKYLLKAYKNDSGKRPYFDLVAIPLPAHIADTSFPVMDRVNQMADEE